MSEGAICETCRHYRDHHDKDGKCQFSHRTINNGEVCPCENWSELKFDLEEFLRNRKADT